MRHWAALALVLLLGACAGGLGALPRSPHATAPAAPQLGSAAIHAEDGAVLPLREWLPQGPVKATILAVHGFNDYSNAFDRPGNAWAAEGIATYAYDQRGFGRAPERGLWPGAWRLDEDLAIASRLVALRHPGVPHYILGESMGGAVVITAATGAAGADRPVADGLILSAPAVWGRTTMNVFERVALWAAYRAAPGMTLTGRGLGIVPSDNLAMLRGLARDPTVIKETRVDALSGLVDLMDLALDASQRLEGRLLVLYGAHDEIIPAQPMRLMLAGLPKDTLAESRIALYPEGYHMLLRDLDARVVDEDVAHWVKDPSAPLPSAADRTTLRRFAAGE